MPNFFAQFTQVGKVWLRQNTRIYLSDFSATAPRGSCLGAIIAKNPGSARAGVSGWGELRLDGDKLLPSVRNILLKAFDRAGKAPPVDAYFQVLNLFYICGKDLNEATARLVEHKDGYNDPAESDPFPLVWFAWGGKSRKLDALKTRFLDAHKETRAFFYSPGSKCVVSRPPGTTELAKHPQGLRHEPLISYFAAQL